MNTSNNENICYTIYDKSQIKNHMHAFVTFHRKLVCKKYLCKHMPRNIPAIPSNASYKSLLLILPKYICQSNILLGHHRHTPSITANTTISGQTLTSSSTSHIYPQGIKEFSLPLMIYRR